MTGSKSPQYFMHGIKALSNIVKQSQIKVFDGLDHYSPEEKVNEIANYIMNFYATVI